MKTSKITILIALPTALLIALLLSSNTGSDQPGGRQQTYFSSTKQLPQVIRGVDFDKDFAFAGEELPMNNFDVRERLDREFMVNSYWHSSTVLNLKMAHRYFPVIEPILKQEGVPDDFKYLAVAESSLRPVTSPSGAKGLWQFLENTGEGYGLEINDEIDERYHVEKATRAACEMLRNYRERFGNWTLAAAAYNMGSTSMARELERQASGSYYDMNLSEETMRYIFRIVALKEIMTDPTEFGFYLEEDDLYPPLTDYTVVRVEGPVESWGEFAAEYGTTYRMLKIYNPFLRSYRLSRTPSEPLEIRIPKVG